MIHKKKSVLRVIFGIIAAIAFVFACLLGDLIYDTRFKMETLSMTHVLKLIRLINQHHQMEPMSFHSSRLVMRTGLLDIHMQDLF